MTFGVFLTLLIIACIIMVMVMHNVIRYVIIQKQYKSWFIVTFYSLAVLLLFQNICEHIVQMMGTSMISTFVDMKKN